MTVRQELLFCLLFSILLCFSIKLTTNTKDKIGDERAEAGKVLITASRVKINGILN